MTREQLEHAIRAACSVADETELFVFGSQAILGTYPDAPESLRTSIEVDVQPKNQPANTDRIDGALGELSRFHSTHGFYVHGITIDSATLPEGWEARTVAVCHPFGTNGNTGHCLEPYDLAASKLVANREKDRTFVATPIAERLIGVDVLIERVRALPVPRKRREALAGWLRSISEEIGGPTASA